MTEVSERDDWNERYASGSHGGEAPDRFLSWAYAEYVEPMLQTPGRALDLAGGLGRHSVWLAQRGWRCTLMDVADRGLEIAEQRADAAGVKIDRVRRDLSVSGKLGSYQLILNFFYLERSLYPEILAALAPGAFLVFKTYTERHPALSGGKGPTHPMHLLKNGELLRAFRSLDILYYRETVTQKGIAELVARRP